jgi:hypothetical protein
MSADETLSLVRTYHEAWTSKNFDQAVSLLAIDLKVEVPINDYPTTSPSPPRSKASVL